MEEAKVCRVCLIADCSLYDLRTFPLQSYFEAIVGINPLNTMELPPYICYECAALVTKYSHFQERCLLTQSVLYDLLNTTGTLTSQVIAQVNREELNITSKLKPHIVSEERTITLVYDEDKIKNEPNEYATNDDYLKTDFVKEEASDLDLPNFMNEGFSSDDEPLSVHRSNKGRVRTKKKVRKGRKSKEEIGVLKQLITDEVSDLRSEPTQTEAVIDPPKRKRGRPKKDAGVERKQSEVKAKKPRRTRNTGGVADDDDDLEEYVTIIKLSVEEQIEEITKRQQSSNYLNAPFQCNLCFKGFIDTHAWKHHVGKHDPSAGDIECPICKFRFKTKRTLQKHAANHEKKYACKACPYISKTTTQAKQHQKWHKGVTYKCQYCDDVSTKWTSYLSHVRIKHPSEFICGACGYSFVSKLGLTMHRTMMHKDIADKAESELSGPYCEQCDVKFVSAEAYKRHMVTSVKHTASNDFNTGCRVCGDTFPSSEELRVHHRRMHARKRPRNYGKKPAAHAWPASCQHCSEQIPNARQYWTHFRRVHPDKPYPIQKNHVCDICGKSFRGNAFLVYHKRTHFEERAFKCAQCDKAFHNRTNLQMHEKTHSDLRPYPCDVCFKAFKGKGALDRHYRSHTGVKPYECEVCGKAFGQSNSRKLHVRTVHLKQPAPYVSKSRLERRRQPYAF